MAVSPGFVSFLSDRSNRIRACSVRSLSPPAPPEIRHASASLSSEEVALATYNREAVAKERRKVWPSGLSEGEVGLWGW